MKKTNLALAIFAAIAVAACGGSSSNDNAAVDKKPETPVTPTKPTTGGNETPETPKTPEETKPETPAVAGGGAGGKTDGEKPKEKKPENAGGGGGKSVPTTAAEAEKVLKRSEKELQDLNKQRKQASERRALLEKPLTDILSEMSQLTAELNSETSPPTEDRKTEIKSKLVELQKEHDEKKALLADDITSAKAAEEKFVAAVTKKEIEVAKNEALHARLAEEPQAKVNSLDLKAKVLELTQARKEAETDKKNAENEYSEKNQKSDEVDQKVTDAENRVKELALNGTPEEKEAARQKMKEAKDEQKNFRQELAVLKSKKDKAETHFDKLDEELKKTEPKAKEAEKIAKNIGFSMNGAAIGDIKKIDKIEKEENGNYLIMLKGEEKPFQMILKGDGAAKKISDDYGYFGAGSYKTETEEGATAAAAPADGKKADPIHYALKTNVDSEEATATDSGYGYIGESFYHFGQLTDLAQMNELAKVEGESGKAVEVEYKGTAFVKEILPAAEAGKESKEQEKPRMLVAEVDAKANFAGDDLGHKTFNGSFKNFKTYLNAKGDDVELSTQPDTSMKPVNFKAVIDGNTFKPADYLSGEVAETNAKVNGNFYGQNAANFGGLVEHKTFSGSFGGTKASKE